MFDPSKTGKLGTAPTATVSRIPALESSLSRVEAPTSVTHTLVPSKTAPERPTKPVLTVVTAHGVPDEGVTIDTEPSKFAVHMREPSKTMLIGLGGRVATAVAGPGDWVGSIM